MLNSVFTDHLTDLQSALSRTTQRQSLLMTNLANVNVPGYKRKDIDFHSALQNQMGGASQAEMAQRDAAAQAASDAVSLSPNGNNVDMEKEMTGISQTALRFSALTTLTSSYFSSLKNVIKEGR